MAGKIKKLLENELVGGTQTTDVYPVTSTKAVYDENNERLDNIINKIESGIIYDVSANNDGAVFESLQALLSSSSLSTLIPTSVRCGGMSIRFIQGSVPNSDNKYVQYRLMSDTFNTTPSNWQGVDDEPTSDSRNLVESKGIYDTAVKPLIPTLYIPTHTLISGKFIGSDGIEGSNAILNRTSSIHLNVGDRLSVRAKASGNVSVISIDNGDNTFTPKVLGKSWENYSYYNYISEEDCNVTISYEYQNGANQYYITIIPEFYRVNEELVSKINPIAICPSYSVISGKYIGADNLEGSNATYSRTSPIHLNKGNRVFVKAKVPKIIGVIATVNSDNTFSSVVLGKTWENYDFYAYTAERDCDVTITYISNYGQDNVDISIIPCFENTKENIKDNFVFEREPSDWEVKYGYYNKTTDEFFVSSDDRTFISYLHKVNAGEKCHIFGNAFAPSVAAQVVYYADKEMTTVIGKETTSTEGAYDIYVTIPEGTNYVLVYFTLTLRLIGNNNVINCIGNSLTEGQDGLTNPVDDTVSSFNSYTKELKEYLPDFKIMNYGYGGNNPSSIFCCAGLADMIINMDFVLKAYPNESLVSDNSQSSLNDSLINKAVSNFLLQGANPESNIARIFGNYHGNPITLRRRSAGENAVVVGMAAEGTIGDVNFKSGDSIQLRGVENRDGISIIFCGHNDLTWYNDTQLCVNTYKKVVENLNNNKYLILGMCTSDASQLQAIQTTNEALRREFGNHFIDLTRWLCSETSFAEMNYTITEDSDISAERQAAGVYSDRYGINNNLIPSSFWRYSKTTSYSGIDNVHLNKLGYKALAYAVFKRLSYLKWV